MVIAGVRPHKARPAPQGDSTTLSSRDGLGPFRIEMPGRTDPARSSASSNVRQPGSLLTTNALLDDVWGHQFVTRRRPQTALHRNGCRDAAIALIAAPRAIPAAPDVRANVPYPQIGACAVHEHDGLTPPVPSEQMATRASVRRRTDIIVERALFLI